MKNVVIWGVANYKWLWLPLAKELKDKLGVNIHFICPNRYLVDYWKRQDTGGVIETITHPIDFFLEYDNCSGSSDDIYAQARFYEKRYDTLVVDVLQSDRHLGRGFFAAGIGHPKSRLSDKASYIKSVNIFNRIILFWEGYFERTKPDLIVGVVSGVIGKCCAAVARRCGIPMRTLSNSRYQSYFYWGEDEYYSFPQLKRKFDSIKDVKEYAAEEELVTLKRFPTSDRNYKVFMKNRSLVALAKNIVVQLKKHGYMKLKGIVLTGNYRFSEDIRRACRNFMRVRAMYKMKMVKTEELRHTPFVFFPLQMEPESTLNLFSPEFNEQLAAVELIAKNLPAGILLVVKEHLVTVGSRPRDFYSTIMDIPNAVMLSPFEYALDAARMSRCVVTITSTLGAEAAMLGIPVISFGVHNDYNFLPHVHIVESWKELRPLLAGLCGEDTEEAKRRRREDGMRYLAVLKASAVDLSWSDYTSKKRPPATQREIEVLYSSLMRSLGLAEYEL